MKTQILIIKPHSFVDVITNSSTEMFICETDKTKELVTEVLQTMLTAYLKGGGQCDYGTTMDDVFNIYAIEDDGAVSAHKKNNVAWATSCPDYFKNIEDVSVGDIIVVGTSDNSIPYAFFEMITQMFNGRRYHLG